MNINQNNAAMDKSLFDALYALMQTMSIEELTVGDIIERAGASRTSFYRRFADKYDLLIKSYEKLLENTYLLCLKGQSWKESAVSLYRVIAEHPRFFRHALVGDGGASLRCYICQISIDSYVELFRQRGLELQNDWKMQKTVEFFVYGTCELMCRWAQEGFTQTAETMIDLYWDFMPDALKPYCS